MEQNKTNIQSIAIIILCIVIMFLAINIAVANADKQYAINNYKRAQEEKTELLNVNAELQDKADALQSIVEQDNRVNNIDTRNK